ncbi:hypothetical protein [Streptomyces noursei]|uniref:hypothetical protein n=1 Tax=Streptomyces noursei TaxID=1971 RepID=UPI0022A6A7B8|nr:hypothetical protein [Streptomyces noursei]MCZ1013072.1 hypothetical protein [Streptomyces noursei]
MPVAAPATVTARSTLGGSDGPCPNGRNSDRHNYCWGEKFTNSAFDTNGKEIGRPAGFWPARAPRPGP